MKQILHSLVILFVFSQVITAQQTFYVSNNTAFDIAPADGSIDYVFDNLKDAVDAASDGDIIMIQGSANPYSISSSPNDTIDKAVFIYGPGYFINENPNSNQVNNTTAIFDDIVITAEGAYISGLDMGELQILANNVVIQRNRIDGILIEDSNNVGILQNFIESIYNPSFTTLDGSVFIVGICEGLIISSNIFKIVDRSIGLNSGASSSGIISNNLFFGYLTVTNIIFENNIFRYTGNTGGTNSTSGNSFYNNIFSGTYHSDLDGVNGNQIGVGTDLFVGTTDNSTDGQYQVADGTAADNAGTDGTDCGAFGGSEPYVLSGVPAIPQVYHFQAPTSTSNENLEIEVKVRTNN